MSDPSTIGLNHVGSRRIREAVRTLCHTMLLNVYLVPFVLGHHPRRLDVWHGSNWEWPEYAAEVPQALLNLWDDVASSGPVTFRSI